MSIFNETRMLHTFHNHVHCNTYICDDFSKNVVFFDSMTRVCYSFLTRGFYKTAISGKNSYMFKINHVD